MRSIVYSAGAVASRPQAQALSRAVQQLTAPLAQALNGDAFRQSLDQRQLELRSGGQAPVPLYRANSAAGTPEPDTALASLVSDGVEDARLQLTNRILPQLRFEPGLPAVKSISDDLTARLQAVADKLSQAADDMAPQRQVRRQNVIHASFMLLNCGENICNWTHWMDCRDNCPANHVSLIRNIRNACCQRLVYLLMTQSAIAMEGRGPSPAYRPASTAPASASGIRSPRLDDVNEQLKAVAQDLEVSLCPGIRFAAILGPADERDIVRDIFYMPGCHTLHHYILYNCFCRGGVQAAVEFCFFTHL